MINLDLIRCVEETGRKFVFIIDEWDVLIREAKNEADIQMTYLNLLREWFKNSSFTSKVVAAAYMTGILPIKKDGSQSAISDFTEHPILDPGEFAEFTGFTENEVKGLCERHGMNFLEDTIAGDSDAVVKAIETIRTTQYAPTWNC